VAGKPGSQHSAAGPAAAAAAPARQPADINAKLEGVGAKLFRAAGPPTPTPLTTRAGNPENDPANAGGTAPPFTLTGTMKGRAQEIKVDPATRTITLNNADATAGLQAPKRRSPTGRIRGTRRRMQSSTRQMQRSKP
jgi:hypothetical protein